jgi:hypothetical protein
VGSPDAPGFPKLVAFSERGKGGGGVMNSAWRVAEIGRALSIKTSTRPGNYLWWPVRPRGGLRQHSCDIFCILSCFFF